MHKPTTRTMLGRRARPMLLSVISCLLIVKFASPAQSLSHGHSSRQVASRESEPPRWTEGQSRFKRRTGSRLQASSNQLAPEFSAPIGNITAVLGRDVRLVCTVENLGQYQVAWLKEETKTILSIDTNIIITNYRIFLIPDEEERKWVLHIKDVQESDREAGTSFYFSRGDNQDDQISELLWDLREAVISLPGAVDLFSLARPLEGKFSPAIKVSGYYQCQVNTNPMRSTSGYLEVVVPPNIVESQTSQVVELIEHSNASIQCKANGHPKPMISWHREDGQPIRLSGQTNSGRSHHNNSTQAQLAENVKSDKLTLVDVDRTMAGLYVCVASNGIPSQVSKRIPLFVKFAPKVSVQNKYISVSLNEQLEVDCMIEAFPKPNSYWSKQRHSDEPFPAPQRWASLNNERNAISFRRNKPIYEQIASAASDEQMQPLGERIGLTSDEDTTDRDNSSHTEIAAAAATTTTHGHYVSVKQVAVNSYTYKLRLTIARMHLSDFGEYICVSSNSIGQSEAHVIITRADKTELVRNTGISSELELSAKSTGAINSDQDNDQYQRDSLVESSMANPTSYIKPYGHNSNSQGARNTPHTNRIVVYDENYLQAIKSRAQANGNQATAGAKLQEKLRMKPHGSSGRANQSIAQHYVLFWTVVICFINLSRSNLDRYQTM